MKQFACGDVVPSCGRTFTAPTEDDILAAVAVTPVTTTASRHPREPGGPGPRRHHTV
jgi:hypothetical protein